MNIVSINVNGLRSYDDKGALDNLITALKPDVLCIQESKCDPSLTDEIMSQYDYSAVTNNSKFKKGYAGVVTAVRNNLDYKPKSTTEVDLMEDYGSGRILASEFDDFVLINVYSLNSGNKEDLRETWNAVFSNYIKSLIDKNKEIIITGDLNVVSTELDYWSDYESAIDSMPGLYQFEIDHFHEMTKTFNLVDAYRKIHPQSREYSWYSYRGGARLKNHGWRLDYFLCTESIFSKVTESMIFSRMEGSDHNPIYLNLNL